MPDMPDDLNLELRQALMDAADRFHAVVAAGGHHVYKVYVEYDIAIDPNSYGPLEVPPMLTAAEEAVLWALIHAQDHGVVFQSPRGGASRIEADEL